MKNNIIFSLLGVSFLLFLSCKKNEIAIPTPASEIAYVNMSPKDFYVLSTSPGDIYKIPVGITTPLDRPVTINLSYTSSTAVAGTHYSAPASVTIPAGKVLDTVQLRGFFANIPAGVAHEVVAKITGGDLPALIGKDSVVITLRRYCTVNVSMLNGTYNTTETSQYYGVSNYQMTVSGATATSATTATATLGNVWNSAINGTITFDWTEPANFKVSMTPAVQTTQFVSAGSAVLLTLNGTPQTFSSCANTINLGFRLYRQSDNALFDIWRVNMVRQ